MADLKTQYYNLKPEIDAAISRILESSAFILGPEVAALEEEFAAYSGAALGIGVNSGTSAIHLALLAADIGEGHEVITTPFTFVATAAAIRYTGARPVFVDIDALSFNIDPAKIEAAITAATRAIMPVHLYGQPADMDPILDIARRHNLIVIEDAAQAHAAEYKGRRCGSIGDMACFSFYPGKNLGAFGEGGMVTTSNPDYAKMIRMLRDWGSARKYEHTYRGFNYRLEGIQGAVLRVKLRQLDAWTEARRANAAMYNQALGRLGLSTPEEMQWARHVYHVYTLRTTRRAALQQHLHDAGIQSGIHYPVPIHLQPAHADLGYAQGSFPHAEKAANEVLSLPVHPELTPAQLAEVVAALESFAVHLQK